MRAVNCWTLKKLFEFTGVLSAWGMHGPCVGLCEFIDRQAKRHGIAVEEITEVA